MIDRNRLLVDGAHHRAGLLLDELSELIASVPECRKAVIALTRTKLGMGYGGGDKKSVSTDKAAAALAEARALRNGHVESRTDKARRAAYARKPMSPAAKRALSKRMKKQWAAARAVGVKRGQGMPSHAQIAQAEARKRKAAVTANDHAAKSETASSSAA